MIERKYGRIVNIASNSGLNGHGSYRLGGVWRTEGGVIALSRALAWEFGGYGITVNCASPGWIVPHSPDETGNEQLLEEVGIRLLHAGEAGGVHQELACPPSRSAGRHRLHRPLLRFRACQLSHRADGQCEWWRRHVVETAGVRRRFRMDLGLKGKTVIVTGAGSNIGRGILLEFAREGSRLVAAEKDEEQGKRAVEEANKLGGQAVLVRTDVTDWDSVQAMVQETLKTVRPDRCPGQQRRRHHRHGPLPQEEAGGMGQGDQAELLGGHQLHPGRGRSHGRAEAAGGSSISRRPRARSAWGP